MQIDIERVGKWLFIVGLIYIVVTRLIWPDAPDIYDERYGPNPLWTR